MTNHFVAIEGVIGVGKTTLARMLQGKFHNASLLLEVFEENPFLSSFYQDRERYAFQTQLFFLLSRYHQQNKAVPEALLYGPLVSDYTFAKDELFAWLNLKDDELAMYGRVHAALSEKIPKPSLIVYLYAEHDVVMRRIALRDRPYERNMDPQYIRELAAAYQAWLSHLQDIPVLHVDVTQLDFLASGTDLEQVAGLVQSALAQYAPAEPDPADSQVRVLQQGRLSDYQEFHRQLEGSKRIEIDNRASLRGELADLLAYTLKLANYTGVDLEQAYLEKMRKTLG